MVRERQPPIGPTPTHTLKMAFPVHDTKYSNLGPENHSITPAMALPGREELPLSLGARFHLIFTIVFTGT